MSEQSQKISQRFLKDNTAMSWLIVGGKGLGKRDLVESVAKDLLGTKGMTSGFKILECGLTEEAKKRIQKNILEGKSVENVSDDDKKNEITVEDIRGGINFLSLKTTLACKILVISLAEQMNINAQNALLKTLEEPFEKTLIFLLSENPAKLLPTILSRCQKVYLRPKTKQQIEHWIEQKYPSEKNLSLVAELSQGMPGIADEICAYDGLSLYRKLNCFLVPMKQLNISAVLDFSQEVSKDKYQWHLSTYFILKFLNEQSQNSSLIVGQKFIHIYHWVESLIRKTDMLYLDKAQVFSDIIFKIAEQLR